ncbi:hypothetical protein [Paracidobacterium acidisoli]|uniref:Uncharacterized protein n=1 Tax=Paracidobacterium acidisoli TaxID=2303751 RepID=A0A372IN86_9BACT|nr:hypothetical protein [Paracidobacterium acidisoli]MBT9331677.1 hypothetical protein [Paracidobacterium acidisoli]
MTKPMAKLERWAVVDSIASQSFRELQPGQHLTGYIPGGANLPNAKFIYTSVIIHADVVRGVVETLNTLYELGKPSEEYRVWDEERRRSTAA